jgi:hypothetical protein
VPTAFDNIFVPLAEQLIDKTFGFSVTHRREARTYDPATRLNTVSNTDTAVLITPPAPYAIRRINGTTVLDGDQWTKMSSASGIIPTSADKFIIGGVTWQVVRVEPIVSGEQTAAYTIQLRQ